MATATITNEILDPSGDPVSGARVVARLLPLPGFRTSDSSEIANQVETVTNGDGEWSLTLEKNADITPANTYYEITEYVPEGRRIHRRAWSVAVTADLTLLASLITPPTANPSYDVTAALNGTYVAYVTGLAGDGVTDDLAVLQAALTAVPSAGGMVILPAGTFLLSDTLYIKSNTRLVGASQASTTLKRKASTQSTTYASASTTGRTSVVTVGPSFNTGYTQGAPGSNVTIEHLTIDGNRQNQTYPGSPTSSNFFAHGFSARYVDDVNIWFVTVKNSTMSGIYTFGGNRIRISKCNIINCGDSAMGTLNKNGISLTGASSDTGKGNNTVEDCYVSGALDEGVMWGFAADVTITGCHIVSSGLKGIEGDTASTSSGPGNVIITGNHIDTCGEEAIGIGNADNQKIVIADNRLANTTFSGISVSQASESTYLIEGNIIEGVAGGYSGTPTSSYHGIVVAGHKVVIVGNEIRDCAGTGISLQKGRLINTSENTIENCAGYGINFPASSTDTLKSMRLHGNIIADCDLGGIRVTNTGMAIQQLSINDNVISEIGKASAGISPGGILLDGSGTAIKRVQISGNVATDERVSPEMGNGLQNLLVNAITSADVTGNIFHPGKFRGIDGRDKFAALMANANVANSSGGVFRNLFGSAAPVSGDGPFLVGDIAYNNAPSSGGVLGWVCTVAGTPGTWVPFYVNETHPWLISDLITSGEEVFHRGLVVGSFSLSSTNLRLAYFTARKTETITQVALASAGTAAGATPTLARIGVWTSNAAGDLLAQVAATANDTSLFAGANTAYTKSLSASWDKVKGQRYAFGELVVTGATAPSVPGGTSIINSADAARGPRMSASLGGQSDLPATATAASLTNNNTRPFAVFLP